MIFQKTKLEGVFVIHQEPITDERGYFSRLFGQDEFKKNGINFELIQASISYNRNKGTLRGMHFQKEPKAEEKIVSCIKGSIFDVAVDLRPGSATYGEWIAEELSAENKKLLYIPKGFAHGFQSLEDGAEVQYFISEFYSPEIATGVRFNDPKFNISWPLPISSISEKDKNWPLL